MEFAVRLQGLKKDYVLGDEVVHALRETNLDVPQGDYVAIMGPSGSGKSTLLNMLGCLDQATAGRFYLGDTDVGALDDDQLSALRSTHIGFIFQSYNLIPQLTVLENIEAPLYYAGRLSSLEREYCRRLAQRVGLGERLRHRPMQLSGGQQQRAGIARSLSNDPRFILADEPTGNLDSATTSEILDLLDELNAEGKTIILVTHEDEVAARARRVVRLKDGRVESDMRQRPVAQSPAGDDDAAPQSVSSLALLAAAVTLRLRTLQLGVKSLQLHPLRSLLTVLGILVGVASVIWLLAIGEGISAKAQQQIAELGANNILLQSDRPPVDPDDRTQRPWGVSHRDCQLLERIVPSIELTAPTREVPRRELRYQDRIILARLVACTADYQSLNGLQVAEGRFITPVDLNQEGKICILAAEVAATLFPIQNPIGRSIRIDADYYRVAGIMHPRESSSGVSGSVSGQNFDQDVYVPISTYWARSGDFLSRTEDGIPLTTRVTVRVRNDTDVLETADAVRLCMADWHDKEDYEIVVPLELLEQARSTRLMFIILLGMIAAISLVVGGIGVMNIMLATVTERTREIGIRRALGAKRWDITRQFLVETVVLSIVGGLVGILVGLSCGPLVEGTKWLMETNFPEVMESVPASLQDVSPIVVSWSIPLAFGISMGVGVVFGLYPAMRAARMNPIEALRHT